MKVALIISGMLRNYEAAALSIPIWGDCDRYLVTWKSAEQHVPKYKALVDIKDQFIIDDSEFENQYCEPFTANVFRMMYLWQKAYERVPKHYDKYVVIRPDGFYWTTDIAGLRECVKNEGPFKTNTFKEVVEKDHAVLDHILLCDATGFNQLASIMNDVVQIAWYRYYYNKLIDVHFILFDYFYVFRNQDVSSEIVFLVDCLFVRDTFRSLPSDVYDVELYKAVFYDSAAWWRRTAHVNCSSVLRSK